MLRNPFRARPLVPLLTSHIDHLRRLLYQNQLNAIDNKYSIQACQDKIDYLINRIDQLKEKSDGNRSS